MADLLMTESSQKLVADIVSLSHDGRGVAKVDGKTVFIDGALPGETVSYTYKKRKRKFDEAVLDKVIHPSTDRVQPQCPHFELCGGCSLQHLSVQAQLKLKQQSLSNEFEFTGRLQAESWLPPLQAQVWGYRSKARLGVRFVAKKGRVLIGFREKRSSFVTDSTICEVLDSRVGHQIDALAALIDSLSIRDRLPQIEIAADMDTVCLILRVLDQSISAQDQQKLLAFAEQQPFIIMLQFDKPIGLQALQTSKQPTLRYVVDGDISLHFQPQHFIQVNQGLNQLMIARAIELLQLQPADKVLDLFCGLGNFSLPIARRVADLIGVEGAQDMVEQASYNANINHIQNARFYTADLFQQAQDNSWLKADYNKVLLDPPRSGAKDIIQQLPHQQITTIVYVSCNPATLARDAEILVHQYGYRLQQTGVMDMFPHTAHSEAIAVFVN